MLTWKDKLPALRLESTFADFKPALTQTESLVEANRCINCFDAPCTYACPTHIDVPRFITRIAEKNNRGAAQTILDSNILGLSCAQSCPTEVLCEGACVYNALNKKPISIGKLQRFAIEYAYDNGLRFFEAGHATGKRVALIGAGPASLACAHELRKIGHETVIFEKNALPGGLNTYGIAPYKMRAETSLREIDQVLSIGVRIEYGKSLGRDVNMNGLLKDFDAVFLGMGLGSDSFIDVEGMNATGVVGRIFGAVDFISQLKTRNVTELVDIKTLKTAVVVGGGNTALDACRELKGLGIENVIVSYRRGRALMSGYTHEAIAAKIEGVDFRFFTIPTKFESKENGVLVELSKTDNDGKEIIEAQIVLMATGQSKLEKELSGIDGLKFEKGKLMTDIKTGVTGNARVFAGGDLANGGTEVVNAVAEGKRSAQAMHRLLFS